MHWAARQWQDYPRAQGRSRRSAAPVFVSLAFTRRRCYPAAAESADVVTIPDGKRGILSRKHGLPASYPKTGAYSVDVKEFERLALPSLSATACDVVVIDEIGRMELHSDAFQREVRRLLDDGTTRLLGAITAPIYGHRVPFCDEVSSVAGVHVEKITKKTPGMRDATSCRARCSHGKSE